MLEDSPCCFVFFFPCKPWISPVPWVIFPNVIWLLANVPWYFQECYIYSLVNEHDSEKHHCLVKFSWNLFSNPDDYQGLCVFFRRVRINPAWDRSKWSSFPCSMLNQTQYTFWWFHIAMVNGPLIDVFDDLPYQQNVIFHSYVKESQGICDFSWDVQFLRVVDPFCCD